MELPNSKFFLFLKLLNCSGRQFLILILLLSVCIYVPKIQAATPADPQFRVAVLNIETSEGIPENYSSVLSDRLRQELLATGKFAVMERSKMTEILDEIGFQMIGCTSNECLIEAGQILGVNQMVAGSAGRMGQIYTVSVRLIDVATSQIIKMVSVDRKCNIEELLTIVMEQSAKKLAGMDIEEMYLDFSLKTGDLQLSSKPSGASVILDGKPTEFTTPCKIEKLAGGAHSLRLVKDNLVTTQQLDIAPDINNKVKFSLEQGYGSLSLKSNPPGGAVLIADMEYGVTPLKLDSLPAGDLSILVKLQGYNEYADNFTLNPDENKELDISFNRLSVINLTSDPPGSKVYHDGKYAGLTPIKIADIVSGKNDFLLKKKGYSKHYQSVDVEPNKLENLKCELMPKKRLSGVFYSTFIPGTGQIYAGHAKGYGILTLQLLTAGAAYYYVDQHSAKVEEYKQAREAYEIPNSVYQSDIDAARTKMDKAYAESEDMKNFRDIAILSAAVVYLYNMIDITFISDFPKPVNDYSIGMKVGENKESVQISLKYNF